MLMSAGVPLPKTVFAHGFVNDANNKKMSKTEGNVVDPNDILNKFDAHARACRMPCTHACSKR